jgi:MFS family permease
VSDTGRQVRLRRGPRVGAFLLVGLVVGALAGLAIALASPPSPQYPLGQVVGFLVLLFAAVGIVLAGLVAVLLDAASRRRARVVQAEREAGTAQAEEQTPPA